jgi:homoserine O-acetyltransferase
MMFTCVILFLFLAPHFLYAEDGVQQVASLGTCKLESGRVIEPCRIGYRTFGKLNAARDNAVLMPTWYNGRTEDLQRYFSDHPVPDQLVDTSRFFGVAIDALGDGVSSSPSTSGPQHGVEFPAFTIRDMVETQYRLVSEVLHLTHVHAVIGISMGGMQTFQWAISHPDFLDLAVPIVGTPRETSFDLLAHEVLLDAILSDPAYGHGNYASQPPLQLANEYVMAMLTSPAYRVEHTTREEYPALLADARKPQLQDANDRVWQLRAVMTNDAIPDQPLETVAKSTRVKFLIINAAQDHMVNPEPATKWAHASGAEFFLSQANCGHLVMDCEPTVSSRVVRFLAGSLKQAD